MTDDRRHTLADHALGALFDHSHEDHDHDHDHDQDFAGAGEGAGDATLISLGLDIGSSSTQAVLSRLSVHGARQNDAEQAALYVSPIMATPFCDNDLIDEEALWRMVERVFREAGLGPDEVDTGAVILTGAAAGRTNAAAIGARLSQAVGDLVCIAAGHHMEAMLAAFGSGAVRASREDGGRRLLLVDVGGATTKLALVERGEVLATAAMAVGGRLLTVDREDRLTRLAPAGARHAARAGFTWARGDIVPPGGRAAVATAMAALVVQAIMAAVGAASLTEAAATTMLTDPLVGTSGVDGIMISGGVAEYVYRRERRDFGDLGPALGIALRRTLDEAVFAPLLEPSERIRATVLGASRYCVQMSGDTIYISSHAKLLPRRNLPVLRPPIDLSGEIDPVALATAIRGRRALAPLLGQDLVLALRWSGTPSHGRLHALARGIVAGLDDRIAAGAPLYIMLEGDAAASLGAILKDELDIPVEVLVIDGVRLGDFDHVDLGRIRLPSRTAPVTVKSLMFGPMPPSPPGRLSA